MARWPIPHSLCQQCITAGRAEMHPTLLNNERIPLTSVKVRHLGAYELKIPLGSYWHLLPPKRLYKSGPSVTEMLLETFITSSVRRQSAQTLSQIHIPNTRLAAFSKKGVQPRAISLGLLQYQLFICMNWGWRGDLGLFYIAQHE